MTAEIWDILFKLAVIFYLWLSDEKVERLEDEIKSLKKKGSEKI